MKKPSAIKPEKPVSPKRKWTRRQSDNPQNLDLSVSDREKIAGLLKKQQEALDDIMKALESSEKKIDRFQSLANEMNLRANLAMKLQGVATDNSDGIVAGVSAVTWRRAADCITHILNTD